MIISVQPEYGYFHKKKDIGPIRNSKQNNIQECILHLLPMKESDTFWSG
jgi:hypothetical protein